MMKADIFEVTFWANAGLPKACGLNSFPFTEVQQTNLLVQDNLCISLKQITKSQGFSMINLRN